MAPPAAAWLDASDDLLCVVDHDGVLAYANRAWGRLFARPVPTLIGRSIYSLIDENAVPTLAAAISGLASGAALICIDTNVRSGDGARRVISWSSSGRPLDDGNHFLIGRDVTTARAARVAAAHATRTLETVLEHVPDYVTQVDAAGVIIFINRTYPGVTADQVVGTSLYTWLAPADRSRFEDAIATVLRSLTPVTLEVDGSGEDGQTTRYRSQLVPYRESGAVAGVLIFGRDISGELRQKREIERAARFEALGTMASGIAHELNNILAAVVGGVDFIRDAPPGDEVAEAVDELADAARRGVELTRSLSSLAQGGAAVGADSCDLSLVLAAFSPAAGGALGGGCTLTVEAPEQSVVVRGSAHELERVLLALASTARAALGERGHLTVRCRPHEITEDEIALPAGSYAAVDVIDDGPGLSAGLLERVFDPFRATGAAGGRPGLGLAVEYSLVRRLGGELRASSQLGRGTTFTLVLPLAGEAGRVARSAEPSPLAPLSERVVLVADDDATFRAPLVRLLRRAGARVLEARDGLDALDCVRRSPEAVALVLSDVDMPMIGGRALVEALRRDARRIPTVLMTGGPMTEDFRAWAGALGILVLAKPFTLADLLRAVALTDAGATEPSEAAG